MVEPYDAVNRTVLLYNYRTFVRGEDTSREDVLFKAGSTDESFLDTIDLPFLREPEKLTFSSLFEITETIIEAFGLRARMEELPYLIAFQDILFDYEKNNTNSVPIFLEWWEKEKDKKVLSTSEEVDAVRILTIHKSKGLEFKTVIIPFCAWDLDDTRHGRRIWCQNREEGFRDLEYAPLNYSSKLADSHFREDYLSEHVKAYVDNLNLLYVAFTRACKNLIIFAKAGQKGTVSELLYNSLPLMQEVELPLAQENPEDDAVGEYGELCTAHDEKKAGKSNRLSSPREGVPVKMESIETHIEFKQSNRSADFIQGDDTEDTRGQYIRQGQLLHQVFAHIEKADDLPSALERLSFEGVFESDEQKQQIQGLAHWALQHPSVKDWFSGTWELYNECAIVYTDEQGQMQTRRPDRVMRKDGQVVVVDFKFGKKNEAYRAQVQEYMDLLTQMGYTHIRGFLWYVFANELEEVTLPA